MPPLAWLRAAGRPAPVNHLVTALRYIALNPVRARLVARPEAWVAMHVAGEARALSPKSRKEPFDAWGAGPFLRYSSEPPHAAHRPLRLA